MRLIDADALSEKLCETTIFIKDGEVFQRMINDAPTIEPDGDLIYRQDVLSYIDRVQNSGLGKKLTLEFIKKYITKSAPADRPTDEEDQLKFYYVESIDDYWIGMRIDNFYYADWHEGLGFVWSKSRYLLWGEHVVDENTLWKEHTYPSEPVEIPFTDWIVGFVKKYFADRPTGKWVGDKCSICGTERAWYGGQPDYCPDCGAKMRGEEE